MLDRRRRPGSRRFVVATVLFAVLASPLAVAGWLQLNRPAATAATGRFDPNIVRTVPTVDPALLVTTTTVAPQPVAEPAPPAAPEPEPEPEPELVSVAGSRLRRGAARPVSSPALVADVKGSRIGLYSTPGQVEADDTFSNPTWEGLPLVFLVQQRQGDWLEVQLNTRPNQTTAWVRAADVSLRTVSHRIVVSLGARSLTVYEGQTPVMEAPVAIGTSSTPTPRGSYYIDGAVRTPDPTGVYGPYQLSVAAFSEVLMSFGSGVGQIAFHGTNAPGLVGSAVSNGCLRMNNADVTRLANMVAVGTPVQIS
ncbi:MAG TPA: L,D-transpeptidase [Acidimicrobiales bacterium]|nr:L,D-transpeptidase [Acidimicrobiales bacterium]